IAQEKYQELSDLLNGRKCIIPDAFIPECQNQIRRYATDTSPDGLKKLSALLEFVDSVIDSEEKQSIVNDIINGRHDKTSFASGEYKPAIFIAANAGNFAAIAELKDKYGAKTEFKDVTLPNKTFDANLVSFCKNFANRKHLGEKDFAKITELFTLYPHLTNRKITDDENNKSALFYVTPFAKHIPLVSAILMKEFITQQKYQDAEKILTEVLREHKGFDIASHIKTSLMDSLFKHAANQEELQQFKDVMTLLQMIDSNHTLINELTEQELSAVPVTVSSGNFGALLLLIDNKATLDSKKYPLPVLFEKSCQTLTDPQLQDLIELYGKLPAPTYQLKEKSIHSVLSYAIIFHSLEKEKYDLINFSEAEYQTTFTPDEKLLNLFREKIIKHADDQIHLNKILNIAKSLQLSDQLISEFIAQKVSENQFAEALQFIEANAFAISFSDRAREFVTKSKKVKDNKDEAIREMKKNSILESSAIIISQIVSEENKREEPVKPAKNQEPVLEQIHNDPLPSPIPADAPKPPTAQIEIKEFSPGNDSSGLDVKHQPLPGAPQSTSDSNLSRVTSEEKLTIHAQAMLEEKPPTH
ncbi:MAG TPA: hypothetical protein VHM20_00140, partial [Gammaproteobacteria bacterium]|nr:hypothetical protein [Gammaproteobacteria bacterium]